MVGLLDPDTAADLVGSIDPDTAAEVVAAVTPAVAAGLVSSMDADESAGLLRALPDVQRAAVLAAMSTSRSAIVRGLLAWPRESAAARMNPDVVKVRPYMTAVEAIAAVRAQSGPGSGFGQGEVYVTSAESRDVGPVLVGAVSFRDLALAAPHCMVADLMREHVVHVAPKVDREDAGRLLHEHRLTALPVVDDGELLGVLSLDDVADIDEKEATEDAERQGGALPLDRPYLRASPWQLWRKRMPWLLALFIAEMYTGTVLRAFEEELESVIALVFFVPLLIGTGGNTGTQVTTTIIRAMAVGQVELRDLAQVVRKEFSTGLLIAATIAVVG